MGPGGGRHRAGGFTSCSGSELAQRSGSGRLEHKLKAERGDSWLGLGQLYIGVTW